MEEYLPFVSIDTWTIIMSWGNLLILFLLLRLFLFKPIKKVLDARAEEIENAYKSAEDMNVSAQKLLGEYEAKLRTADDEVNSIIKSAVEKANLRSESIVGEAGEKARNIIEKSQRQIERDKQRAVKEAKSDIVVMAAEIAEKLIGKTLSTSDDEKIISDIIDNI